MVRLRPDLVRGSGVLVGFLLVVVITSAVMPYPVQTSEYVFVDIRLLAEDPQAFEGHSISSVATVVETSNVGSYVYVDTVEGTRLAIPSSEPIPAVGDRIMFRGVSSLQADSVIFVDEFYALDYSSSLIRSVPGIALFLVLLFMVFKIDWKHLALVRRDV
ncbi:MAG: hypothetical protein DRP09_03130 [Candidatus Thorarchaeota archaeon]|nr:MAG: hypothetical protein DRP09_03130 [Candidatus Thorarchaeota archaeon]